MPETSFAGLVRRIAWRRPRLDRGRCLSSGGGWVALALVLAALCLQPGVARPCTTFYLDQGGAVIGKSYDYEIGFGLVVMNKRGAAKIALTIPGSTDVPAEWTSKYASVTFVQYGREMPGSGMNEAGLVVEVMWLEGSKYPPTDDRPMVNELQWIQYALDNFASVSELVAAAPGLRVSKVYAPVHYLACDVSGACAALEYVDGQLVVTTGGAMPVKTLTNHTYAESAAYLAGFVGFGGSEPIPSGSGSLDRFVRASHLALAVQTQPTPTSAFAILDSVAARAPMVSQWNLVYLPGQGRVYFRTHTTPSIKFVDLGAFPADCTHEVTILDIDDPHAGDVAAYFQPYSFDANQALLEKSLASIKDQLPPGAIVLLALYPDSTKCTLSPPAGDSPPRDGGTDGGGDAAKGDGGAPAADGSRADAGPRDAKSAPPDTAGGSSGGGCAVSPRSPAGGAGGILFLALPMPLALVAASGLLRRRRRPRS